MRYRLCQLPFMILQAKLLQEVQTLNESNSHGWILEPQATYGLKLGRGVLTVLSGASFHEHSTNAQYLSATGFVSDALLENAQSAKSNFVESNNTQYKYNAIFGRLNYDWENKYLFECYGASRW